MGILEKGKGEQLREWKGGIGADDVTCIAILIVNSAVNFQSHPHQSGGRLLPYLRKQFFGTEC